MSDKELVLSVTLSDCELQTFRSGGKGGQNQNKRDTGVRIIHRPSGAVGESREERSQLQNKKKAWKKMSDSPKFRAWVKMQLGQDALLESEVERSMTPDKIKTEVRDGDRWIDS